MGNVIAVIPANTLAWEAGISNHKSNLSKPLEISTFVGMTYKLNCTNL
jgi:hypothetical protein